MAKGLWTQGQVVLLDAVPSLDEVAVALSAFHIVKRVEDVDSWDFGGPSLVLDYRPEVNGYIAVDIVERAWPDDMGDPQRDPMLFAAWSMGHLGPLTFPGGLERATQQAFVWNEAAETVARHRAFLRVRSSYIFGASDDDRVFPPDYNAIDELAFVTRIANALVKLPQALCYFNPNGEVLMSAEVLRDFLSHAQSHHQLPLDVWTNVRMFSLEKGWMLMDTVGMGQLDVRDYEACFRGENYDPNQVAAFLRNLSLYILQNGDVIKDGHTVDGPGNVPWKAHLKTESLAPPSRDTLRWFPEDGHEPLPELNPKEQS